MGKSKQALVLSYRSCGESRRTIFRLLRAVKLRITQTAGFPFPATMDVRHYRTPTVARSKSANFLRLAINYSCAHSMARQFQFRVVEYLPF